MGAAGFAVFVFAQGVMAFWKDLNAAHPWKTKAEGNLIKNLFITIVEILSHYRFKSCEVTLKRATNHLLLVLGFIGLTVVTAMAAYHYWIEGVLGGRKDQLTGVLVVMKLIALPATAALLYGIWQIYQERLKNAEKAGAGGYYDWLLIFLIAIVGVTGALSWLFRLVNIAPLAYPTYFIHLVSVFFLFFYAPFTKMAHFVYRSVAMLHARMSNRGF